MLDRRTIAAAVLALIDTVDETPEGVPSGMAYAALMTKGIDLSTYQTIVDKTVEAGYLAQSNHLLTITPMGHEFIEKARAAVASRQAIV